MKLFTGKQNRKRASRLAMLGVTFITLGILIFFLNPLQLIVNNQLSLHEGSLLLYLFRKPPLEVFISAYAFNITNLDRFLSGKDKKIKLAEVGPYVYQEFLENRNATFHENGTVTYRPVRSVKFIPEKSCGDPTKDIITVPNIPYMGVTTAASKLSFFAAIAIRALMKSLGSEVILNVSVQDYFWGYEDPLVSLASTFIPNIIHFRQFGLMDRMFDEGNNLVSMNLPARKKTENIVKMENDNIEFKQRNFIEPSHGHDDDYRKQVFKAFSSDNYVEEKETFKPNVRDYSIDRWNGKKGLTDWGYSETSPEKNTECNTLEGVYDGTLFPRNITQGEVFRIYRKPFCRTLPIVYSHPGSLNGIDAFFFKLADNAFDSDINDPTSSCFCTDNICLKKGLGNITPCYYNIPAAASFPHFYNADPSLLEAIDGLNPNEEKHGSEIVLQPQLGVPMRVHSRIQINLLMGDVKANLEMRPFRNIVLPIIWMEIAVESLTPALQILLHLLFNICPYVQTGAICVFTMAGISFLATAGLVSFYVKPIKQMNPKLQKQCSAIYLFTHIQRELSKVDDEESFTEMKQR